MKTHLTTLIITSILSTFATLALASPAPIDIQDGTYTISCIERTGYLALGSFHSADPYIYYLTNTDEIPQDAYWLVKNENNAYSFQNLASGQYLVYTTDRVDQYYKYMTLADDKPDDNTHLWQIFDNNDGTISIASITNNRYYWNLRTNNLLGTYAGSNRTNNERFNLQLTTSPVLPDDPTDILDPATFPQALHIYLKGDRIEAYPLTYVTNYTESDAQLIIYTNIGKTFSYDLQEIDSISQYPPTNLPSFLSFKFNNKFNDQLFTDCIGQIIQDTVFLTVPAIGKRLTPSFKMPDENTQVYQNGIRQDSKVSRLRFDKDIYYVVTRAGITILLPTTATDNTRDYSMQPYGRIVRVHVDFLTDHATSVPRIDINTSDGQPITSKEIYKDAQIIIDGAGVFPSMTDSVQIRGRGNTSWGWEKKPYRLKFDKKVKPFGMTKGKSWVLLSNGQTGSLMANAIGMKAANLIQAAASNHIIPVELYLNGEYRGNYNFTEKIGFANNSIELADESAAALLELDTYYDEPEGQKFRSILYNLPINIKEPDFSEGTSQISLQIVEDDFNDFLTTVYTGRDLSRHVDEEQLIRYLMVNELICNYEFYHPKSTFCYRESFLSDTSKYVFGPVWDLDWSFGYEKNRNYFKKDATSNYWIDMPSFEAKTFIQELRFKSGRLDETYQALWEKFMDEDLAELKEFCKDYYDYARTSIEHNREKWGDGTNYQQQATEAANWLQQRADQIYEDMLNGVKPAISTPVVFDNNKLYTITCRRGEMVLNDDATGLAAGNIRTDATSEEKQFAIVEVEGNHYLYSPVNKMFLASDGTFVDKLGSALVFDISQADGQYRYMISTRDNSGNVLYINHNSKKIVINTYDTPDAGNRWMVTEVGDFDPTEALAVANRSLFDVTFNVLFNNEVVASETVKATEGSLLPEPPSSLYTDFIDLEKRGTPPSVVTEPVSVDYEAVWNGPFALTTNPAYIQWYQMTIRSNYYVGKQETEPYRPVDADGAPLEAAEYQWAFGGDPYHIKVFNRSTGLDEVLTLEGSNVVMRPGEYTWDILKNNDGFVLRILDTDYSCINQIGGSGGELQIWTDSNSPKDNGSTFRVEACDAEFLVGDANLDGKVGIADVTAVVNYILQKPVSMFCKEAADANGDGVITIADVTSIVNIILGR